MTSTSWWRANPAPAATKQELPSLTGLRGLAALWVVLYHYSVQCFPNLDATSYTHLIHKGYLAVDMFFMLSGFVMTHVYHRAFTKSVAQHYQNFIVARVARIYPLHILVLLLFVATAAAPYLISRPPLDALKDVPLAGSQSAGAFVANVLMLQGLDAGNLSWNYPAWSISVEFLAYLLFPFMLPVIWRASARTKIGLALVLFGLLAALAGLTKGNFDQWDGPITLLRCLPEFILGTLLYCAYSAGAGHRWLNRDTAAIVILVAIVVCLHADAPDLLITFLFSVLVLAAVANAGVVVAWMNAAPLIWLGNISYSLYLIHGLVQFLAGKALGQFGIQDHASLSVGVSFVVMMSMIVVCLLASHFSYFCVETGCRQYLRRLLGGTMKHPEVYAFAHRRSGTAAVSANRDNGRQARGSGRAAA